MNWLAIIVVVVAVFGCRGRVPVVEGEGDVVVEGEGDVVGEGEGDVVGEGEGDVVGEGEGEVIGEGEGEVIGEGEGEVIGEGEGDVVGEGEGEVIGEGEGEVVCVGLSVRCGDRCVDVQSDNDNCGVCGDVCADDERCTGGRCNARCVNPRLDVEGTFVGNFPELVGCFDARYDVDRDGAIDDVCGGFRMVTEPEFAVEATGVADVHMFEADVHPAPGLERTLSCTITGERGATLLNFGPAPCALAGSGFTDIDDDGDFDVVMKDGRVFVHSDQGLVPGEPLPPVPGAVTRFRFGNERELVSFDSERRALVRFHDGAWVEAGAFEFAGDAPDAFFELDDGERQTLVIWQNIYVVPNLTLCSWTGTDFKCHLAAANAAVVASPPRDGRFSFDTSATRVTADGHERSDGLPKRLNFADIFAPQASTVVALGAESVWFVDSDSGDVFKRSLQPRAAMPVSARMHRGDAIVDVRIDDGALLVGADVVPLPGGAPRLLVAHPTAPVLWLILNRFPLHETGLVMAVNVETGEVLTETEIPMPWDLVSVQLVSNGDVLELRVGGRSTLAFDATTAAFLTDGATLLPSLDEGDGVIDLDGDGNADGVDRIVHTGVGVAITTASGVVNVGDANAIFGGPGRRQVSIYNESAGAMTWDLLCD